MKRLSPNLRLVHRKHVPGAEKAEFEHRHQWMEMSHHQPKRMRRARRYIGVKKKT